MMRHIAAALLATALIGAPTIAAKPAKPAPACAAGAVLPPELSILCGRAVKMDWT